MYSRGHGATVDRCDQSKLEAPFHTKMNHWPPDRICMTRFLEAVTARVRRWYWCHCMGAGARSERDRHAHVRGSNTWMRAMRSCKYSTLGAQQCIMREVHSFKSTVTTYRTATYAGASTACSRRGSRSGRHGGSRAGTHSGQSGAIPAG